MRLQDKKITIYPIIKMLEMDKADTLTDFTILRTKPLLGETGERFVKKFDIIKSTDQNDSNIYCDMTFDVDELMSIHDAYIELEIDDLVDWATYRFPVACLDVKLNDVELRKNVKEFLREKILSYIRTLKPEAIFIDSTEALC